ncbi:MAG: D-2-hydroxyacid dehydrogenase [Aromatoleum sp.]|nr:D-2-hydroxyacid dehydrogenase [Aromatoleum sp.]
MTQVLVLLAMPENVRMQYYDGIKAKFPELTVNVVDHHSKVDPYIRSADILMTFGPMMSEHVLEKAANLKWIQALGTGVDGIVDRPSLGKDVVVTNLHGVHGAPVSEAAFMSMLALSRQLPRSVRNQAARRWERFPARLLKDKTVGIFGVGVIAEELAPKCKAFGMTVVGISSATREVPGFDTVYARDELIEAVRDLDYLVLLTPYTPATHNSVDAKVLAAMKPGAYLVNLARGGVVDEAALIDALKSKRIAGAALDVFAQEPLPAEHPFWDMDEVIITAHQGGFCDVYVDFALPVIEENLRRFLAGDTAGMTNLVKR